MSSLLAFVAPDPMAHRPPLARRFWVYSVVAYLAPVVLQVGMPGGGGIGDELVWLVTLVPAFLLSLHYGLRGAMTGLLMGTVLFVVVQTVVALNFVPSDWRITLPIYVAYGTLAVSVGWLSEELHTFYQRALQAERLAVIGRAAVAIRGELSDALSVIAAQSELVTGTSKLTPDQTAALRLIRESAHDSARMLDRLTQLEEEPPPLRYSTGVEALDLRDVDAKSG